MGAGGGGGGNFRGIFISGGRGKATHQRATWNVDRPGRHGNGMATAPQFAALEFWIPAGIHLRLDALAGAADTAAVLFFFGRRTQSRPVMSSFACARLICMSRMLNVRVCLVLRKRHKHSRYGRLICIIAIPAPRSISDSTQLKDINIIIIIIICIRRCNLTR